MTTARGRTSRSIPRAACALAVALLVASCARFEGAFTFLREPPKTELIPGVYALDQQAYSFASLREQGYTDLSSTLTLLPDGTFTVRRIPDCCIYGEYGYFGGYFGGAGTWSVVKDQSVFDVRLRFKDRKRDGTDSIKQPELYDEVSFTLTKDPAGYGLAAPLFDGEFQYVYFKKQTH